MTEMYKLRGEALRGAEIPTSEEGVLSRLVLEPPSLEEGSCGPRD